MTDSLSFKVEWEDGGGVRTPELHATWCRLEVWAGSECVTLVEAEASAARRSIFVPLYPLAEWIAYHWWYLVADHRPAQNGPQAWTYAKLVEERTASYEWLRNHNLRSAGEGFPWPDLTLVPEGEVTHIRWTNGSRRTRGGLRYLSSGSALVPSEELLSNLAGVVELVLTRLDEVGVERTQLHEEWSALQALDDEETEFCSAAARLGLDAFNVPTDIARTLEGVGAALSDDLLQDFLDTVEPSALAEGLQWVLEAQQQLKELVEPPTPELGDLRRVVAGAGSGSPVREPWQTGLAQARALREELGLDDLQRFDVELFVSHDLRFSTRREIDGYGETAAGVRLLRSRRVTPPGARFLAARALWHALAAPPETPFLLTRARTTRQKTGRAFAAELLAPSAGLGALLKDVGTLWDSQDAEELAERYGVRADVVERQIENNVRL